MRLFILIACLLATVLLAENCCAQTDLWPSLYKNTAVLEADYRKAKTVEEKTDALLAQLIHYASHNDSASKKRAIEVRQQAEIFVHETGKPALIAKFLYYDIIGFPPDNKSYLRQVNNLLGYAQEYKLPEMAVEAKHLEADYYRLREINYNKLAETIDTIRVMLPGLSDSVVAASLLSFSTYYRAMKQYGKALQMGFEGLDRAKSIGSKSLENTANAQLARVYAALRNYQKSLRYYERSLALDYETNERYYAVLDHGRLGSIYLRLNQLGMADYHIGKAYKLADSLKGSKALLNDLTGPLITSIQGQDPDFLKKYLQQYGRYLFIFPFNKFIDFYLLASSYEKLGLYTQAREFIDSATAHMAADVYSVRKLEYFTVLAAITRREGNASRARQYYQKALELALVQNNPAAGVAIIDSLKPIYIQAHELEGLVQLYGARDSLQQALAVTRDNEEITKQEVVAAERQRERELAAAEAEKQRRYNLQLTLIPVAIALLFLLLAVLGFYKLSTRSIRIVGFISFLFFFEFLFLLFKKRVSVITQGEPWKDLLFMVLLAALLLPLHHWLEHKVVHHLSHKKLALPQTKTLMKRLFAEKTAEQG